MAKNEKTQKDIQRFTKQNKEKLKTEQDKTN